MVLSPSPLLGVLAMGLFCAALRRERGSWILFPVSPLVALYQKHKGTEIRRWDERSGRRSQHRYIGFSEIRRPYVQRQLIVTMVLFGDAWSFITETAQSHRWATYRSRRSRLLLRGCFQCSSIDSIIKKLHGGHICTVDCHPPRRPFLLLPAVHGRTVLPEPWDLPHGPTIDERGLRNLEPMLPAGHYHTSGCGFQGCGKHRQESEEKSKICAHRGSVT
jgi:hypothetical protein